MVLTDLIDILLMTVRFFINVMVHKAYKVAMVMLPDVRITSSKDLHARRRKKTLRVFKKFIKKNLKILICEKVCLS